MAPQKTFDVSAGGSTVLYFRGHPRYDAFRVEFDGGSSGSADTDVSFAVDNENFADGDGTSFGSMTTVDSATTLDPSAGDHTGTTASARTVAVQIDEQGTTNNAAGTVYAHNSSDPAENAEAFANR